MFNDQEVTDRGWPRMESCNWCNGMMTGRMYRSISSHRVYIEWTHDMVMWIGMDREA